MDTFFCISWESKQSTNHTRILNHGARPIHIYLVGGFNPSEKYESMGRIIPYIMENKTCSKPSTSYWCFLPLETPLKIWKMILPPRPRGRWKNSAFRLFRLPHRGTGTPLARTPLDTWPGTRCGRCSDKRTAANWVICTWKTNSNIIYSTPQKIHILNC